MSRPVIISCALSGVAANRDQCPAIPYTPDEYAMESKRAFEAGASVVHIHARKPDTGAPSYDVSDYQAITSAITNLSPELIINYSTGAIGIAKEDRINHVIELKPAIGALNMGSMNYAIMSRKQKRFALDLVFANPFSDIEFFLKNMQQAGTKPEYECFDAGHINNVKLLSDIGYSDARPHFSLVMGVHGGIAATVSNLVNQISLLPAGAHWQVIGVRHPEQWQMVAAACAAGGSVRVGLEDNFYVSKDQMAQSNGDLVAKAARIARDCGREIASPAQAREILNLQ